MRKILIPMAVATLLLSACVGPIPEVTATPELELKAALLPDQIEELAAETFREIAAADTQLDAALLHTRISGVAAEIRKAQYQVATAIPEETVTPLAAGLQATYAVDSETWPRLLLAVSEKPDDGRTPFIYLWQQASVSEPYSLTAWAQMLPGAVFPAMPGASTGSKQLTLDDTLISPTPREVVSEYVDYLRQGGESELAAKFGPDPYSQRIFETRTTLTNAAASTGGAYVETFQTDVANTYAVSAADGGAVVVAPVRMSAAFAVNHAKVSIPATDLPLLSGTLSNKVTHNYHDVLVFYVSAEGQPSIIAASHQLVSVSAE